MSVGVEHLTCFVLIYIREWKNGNLKLFQFSSETPIALVMNPFSLLQI